MTKAARAKENGGGLRTAWWRKAAWEGGAKWDAALKKKRRIEKGNIIAKVRKSGIARAVKRDETRRNRQQTRNPEAN